MNFGRAHSKSPCFVGKTGLFFEEEIRHDSGMAKFKQLRDLYRFPGFVPSQHIRGIFGDPMAVVISLKRCRKKRSAARAGTPTSATTTSGPNTFAIFRAATDASISSSSFEGCLALGVPA